MSHITEFDIVFISYDEPNAEKHWADLVENAPWAKRVKGVKGFDAAHKAAAEQSETDWFITVDADNIVRPEFFEVQIDLNNNVECYSWNGNNAVNGLCYGNGGLKLWQKSHVMSMNTHENADDPRRAVDFCWENNYQQMPHTYSDVWINGSPYQAFRVGFREGVKLALDRGRRVESELMRTTLHPFNLRNLRVWCSVGHHIENGLWACYGTRLGWFKMCDLEWDHTVVRDYDWFLEMWDYEGDHSQDDIGHMAIELGQQLQDKTKITIPLLKSEESAFFREMMN